MIFRPIGITLLIVGRLCQMPPFSSAFHRNGLLILDALSRITISTLVRNEFGHIGNVRHRYWDFHSKSLNAIAVATVWPGRRLGRLGDRRPLTADSAADLVWYDLRPRIRFASNFSLQRARAST